MASFNYRMLIWPWLALMFALAFAGWRVLPHVTLSESSLLKLLPDADLKAAERRILEQVSAESGQTSLWLLETPGQLLPEASVEHLQERLQQSGLYASIGVDSSRFRQMAKALFPWRYHLLANSIRQRLEGAPGQLVEDRLRALYSPGGMARAGNLGDDPFDLFGSWLLALLQSNGTTNEGSIRIDSGTVILPATLKTSGFDLDTQFRLAELTQSLDDEFGKQGITLRSGGVPAYAAWNAVSARSEVSIVGLGSLSGVIVLVLMAFRSLRPLVFAVVVIVSGIFAGATASLLLFDRIHLLTWVFGASLIGIAIDYAMHLLATAQGRPGWTPALGLDRIVKPTAIGFVSSTLGFVALLFTPFPVLREIATFTIAGLVFAWFTCIALASSLLSQYTPPSTSIISTIASRMARGRDRLFTRRWIVVGTVLALAIPGLILLTPDDDITALQAADTPVALDDAYIRDRLPVRLASQFFIVEGRNEQDVLSNEQQLLGEIEKTGVARSIALSSIFSLPNEQLQGIGLLQEKLGSAGLAERFFSGIGYAPELVQAEFARWDKASQTTLSLASFASSLPPPWSLLWQGCDDGPCRSVVLLQDVNSRQALLAVDAPNARLVDQVTLLSNQFARFRGAATLMLLGGIGLVVIALSLIYGWRAALRITLVPCLGLAIAIAMLGLTGVLYSVFNLFALLMVFGLGIDYAVFQHASQDDTEEERSRTELAIALSAATTLLSFGLLAVSQTTVISAFGSTLTAGIIACWFLSPLARSPAVLGSGQ